MIIKNMASVTGLNHFNNLLYATKKIVFREELEHRAGRVGMDLRFRGYGNTDEVLTAAALVIDLQIFYIYLMEYIADLVWL
jgi:hypothetical protein